MRSVLFLLLLFLIFPAHSLPAADSLQGVVVSIDPESGRLAMRTGKKGVTITVSMADGLIPGFVKPGSRVTVWGQYVPARRVFKAKRIAPAGKIDPTGVRSRLIWGN
jgi:hypothetical protein